MLTRQRGLTLLLPLCVLSTMGFASVAGAQTQTKRHKPSFIHRHPKLTAAAAGVVAYKVAKHRKRGFMHRHPVLTGIAAAAVTHHYAKKH